LNPPLQTKMDELSVTELTDGKIKDDLCTSLLFKLAVRRDC